MPKPTSFAALRPKIAAAIPRADAPYDLTDEQADEWRAIVNVMPADHFMRGNYPLLAQFCRHVVAARQIAQLIAKEAKSKKLDAGLFLELLRAQQAETKAINFLSRAMRLSQQTTREWWRKQPKDRTVDNPWEPESEDAK
jgi:hypothetical protein